MKGGIYRVDDLPGWASDVAERLWHDGLMPYRHVDAPVFADTIVSVSVMQFTEPTSGRQEELLVEPKSALVFAGEARQKWKHDIPARSEDVWMDQVLLRGTRVSLTFRKMLQTEGMA